MSNTVFHGWWLVFVAALAQMVGTGVVIYVYSIIADAFSQEFGANRLMMSLGVTGVTLAGGILGPLLGSAIDRGSMRAFMLFGAFALAGGMLALSLVTAMWQIPLIYMLIISFGMVLLGPLTCSTLLARWFVRKRGLVLGLSAMGTSVGGFLFPPLVHFLVSEFGWRSTCQILALLVLVLTLPPILLLVSNRPADRNLFADGATAAAAPVNAAHTARFNTFAAVLRDRNFWLVGIAIGILFAIASAILSNIVVIARDIGIAGEYAALTISVLSLCGVTGKFGFGLIGDRIDLRLGFSAVIALFTVGLMLYVAAMSTGMIGLLLAGALAQGLAAGGALPMWGALLAKLFGADNFGRVMGLMSLLTTLIIIIAMPLTGHLRDIFGSYLIALTLFIGASALSLLLMPFIRMPLRTAAL